MKSKIETLKGYLNWLSEEKFDWYEACKCWDGLLLTYVNGEETSGGCLYNEWSKEEEEEVHAPLYDLGFKFEELRDFEFLIKFWEGEKGSFDDGGAYNPLTDEYSKYYNGIQYIKEWIAHLEAIEPKKEYVVTRVYHKVNVAAELLDQELKLN